MWRGRGALSEDSFGSSALIGDGGRSVASETSENGVRVRNLFCFFEAGLGNDGGVNPEENFDIHFLTTHWSRVLTAGRATDPGQADALEELCRAYWPPLYGFLRRGGHSPEQAADLTQGFFLQLLERDMLGQADPSRGRFRSYLLTSLQRFVADTRRVETAAKRGAGRSPVLLDNGTLNEEEVRMAVSPVDSETPEDLYLRRWALALLELAMNRTRRDYERRGKGRLFDAIKESIWGWEVGAETTERLAERLQLNAGTLRIAIMRLRERFRARLRDCVAETLREDATPEEVDDELRQLTALMH